jgi:hypothetical protein
MAARHVHAGFTEAGEDCNVIGLTTFASAHEF